MKLVLALLFAVAVALTTCSVGAGTISLSGGSADKLGPPYWMDGAYDVRLTMETPDAEGCTDWMLGLAYLNLDTWQWATGPEGVELVDGAYRTTTPPLDDRLRISASVPHACGPWTAEFRPLD